MAKFNYKITIVVFKVYIIRFENRLKGLFAEGNVLDVQIQQQLEGLKYG